MSDFLGVLKQKQALIWPEIKTYLDQFLNLPSFCRIPQRYDSLLKFHQKIVADYPERKGKYLRPTLVLLSASAMGFPEKKAIKTAAAMQISEDWILNHDDIEDDSVLRRGKPALHRLVGKELAINAGDALQTIMWQVLADNLQAVGVKKGKEIINEFVLMLTRTIFGQTVELKWTQENKIELTDKDILFILESKTAYYSLAGPMRLGAILAGANESQLEKIYQFAKPLGYAFQIKDDLLDLTSDFSGLKEKGNDIYEGKRTIMLLHLFRQIRGENKKKLVFIMKKRREEKTKAEVNWVIGQMEKFGSLAYGQQLAEKLIKKAKNYFAKNMSFWSCQPAQDQLRLAIDFMIERKF